MHDLRFALRQLAKSPGFAFVAIATLAVGIGACTAIFSVVNSVLLRPLAYPESERLVVIRETYLPEFPEFSVASGQYFVWRDEAKSFEGLATIQGTPFNLTGLGEPLRIAGRRVTANYLSLLRVHPALGRDFAPEEDAPGKADVVLLTDGFWRRQFGARPDVVGTTVQLNGQPCTVVGVLPDAFPAANNVDVFMPAAHDAEARQNHGGHNLNVIARLAPGATLEQARSELGVIADRLARQFPNDCKGWGVKVAPMLEYAIADIRPVLYSLLGAVGFLLLIACANVASLLLARATARTREISIRTALGAGRGRIVRQLLGESLLLAGLGAALGLLVAHWSLGALLAFAPQNLPRVQEIVIDRTALGFTCALALVTGVGFGLVPALQASRTSLTEALKEGGRGSSEGRHRRRARGLLVVAEVAVSLVLLVGAGLLIRSFARLQGVNPGFEARNAISVGVALPRKPYDTDARQLAFAEQALARLAALPGVTAAGAAHVVPLTGSDYVLGFSIAGRPPVEPGKEPNTNYYAISPGYFQAMGIPLLRGRAFDAHDRADSAHVAIINDAMAKKYFPNQDPLGQRINVTNGPETWREIVGVVGDVQHYRLDGDVTLQTYEPLAQQPFPFLTFVLRTSGPVTGLPAAVRQAIYAVDPNQPVANVRPLAELVAQSISRQRFAMFLFAVFSGVALFLSAIGIYGVMAYSVSQRTGEIGIRMALGAQRSDVLRLIFRQGGRLVLFGLGAGLLGALVLTRFLASQLYHLSPTDPVTFGAIAALLAAVAALACWLPARRATKVDPMVALRAD